MEGEPALGLDRPGDPGDEAHVVVRARPGGAGEDLVGTDGVEGLEAREGDDGDAVHDRRLPRRGDGVNAIIPTFPAIRPRDTTV